MQQQKKKLYNVNSISDKNIETAQNYKLALFWAFVLQLFLTYNISDEISFKPNRTVEKLFYHSQNKCPLHFVMKRKMHTFL